MAVEVLFGLLIAFVIVLFLPFFICVEFTLFVKEVFVDSKIGSNFKQEKDAHAQGK